MKAATTPKIKAIIIDDERLAKGIELLLTDHPHIDVVGTTGSIQGAVQQIEEQRPDLIFNVNSFAMMMWSS